MEGDTQMESDIKTQKLFIGGMTCVNCQETIEKQLRNLAGIREAKVNYGKGTAQVAYEADQITLKEIAESIQKLGYSVGKEAKPQSPDTSRMAGLLIVIAALYLLLRQFGILNLLVPGQLAQTDMSYGMLFFIGLMTSVHCLAMCGGINLSQCIPQEGKEANDRFSSLRPAVLYNLGRVLSYTAVGFAVGGLGSVITFSNAMQGALKLVAGLFMVVMGMNMLGVFPWLRRINPRLPRIFARFIDNKKGSSSPLMVGLFNGLMPCGPLQAMQIYALSTGSPWRGALSMFLFSLGTVPLMFGLGSLSSLLGKRGTSNIRSAGAVLVVVLGLSMLSQGWSLSGLSFPAFLTGGGQISAGTPKVENGVQVVKSTLDSGKYPSITVQAGIPVKWSIDAPKGSINGCNNRMFLPEYDVEHQFQTGENVIEFTPSKEGQFSYSCWMGMIRGTIRVVNTEGEPPAQTEEEEETSSAGQAENSETILEGTPANRTIPTDQIAVAVPKDTYQQVTVKLTDKGFSPAVLVVQSNLDVQWVIQNQSARPGDSKLLVPYYRAQAQLGVSENLLYFYPTDSFDFSNGDNTAYGYVKVVPDIGSVDKKAIQEEAAQVQTMIWPEELFEAEGEAPSCH